MALGENNLMGSASPRAVGKRAPISGYLRRQVDGLSVSGAALSVPPRDGRRGWETTGRPGESSLSHRPAKNLVANRPETRGVFLLPPTGRRSTAILLDARTATSVVWCESGHRWDACCFLVDRSHSRTRVRRSLLFWSPIPRSLLTQVRRLSIGTPSTRPRGSTHCGDFATCISCG